MDKLELYCVTNKPIKSLDNFKYKLAAVGKDKFPDNYIRCDNGINIYDKEKNYSELTFQYWFWKNKLNLNNDNWVGFCQKRRFWLNKSSVKEEITEKNFNKHFLIEPDPEWKNYNAIICSPINVNSAKKMKLIKRGIKSIIKDPSLLFDKNKQTLKVHFDMHHGHGNLDKAVSLMNESERDEFNLFLNNSTSYNPHIMFIAKPNIANNWFVALFDWLFECEKVFGFDNLEGYETQRLYAYLAERYLSFWFKKYTNYIEWPWTLYEFK